MAGKSALLKKIELQEFPQPELIRLKYPVFMCHGFGGLAGVLKSTPLQDPCMKIRSHGVPAIAPNIVPYSKIETRAENWAQLIRNFCTDFGCEKVNVIAHSMGGLDMRYALSKLGTEQFTASLTTIATPHRGASLAEYVLKTPDKIMDALVTVFDWFGDHIYPKTKSDVIGSLEQLTRAYIEEEFNRSVRDAESVIYYSYSAAAGKGTEHAINAILKYQNNVIFEQEGKNDGFVSVNSAKWGIHVQTIPLTHPQQINMQLGKEGTEIYNRFWPDLLKMLAKKGC